MSSFYSRRHKALTALGASGPAQIAASIVSLSDHFIHQPGRATPWENSGTWSAYLNYFLPLNVARLREVFKEVERFLPTDQVAEIWDFGSGPGTLHWVLEEQNWLSPRKFVCLERAAEAIRHHKDLIAVEPTRWKPEWNFKGKPGPKALAVFSYAFLEMRLNPPDLRDFEHVLIVEPATRECGRELMQWRKKMITLGLTPLAPCTHSEDCPLLENSPRDWCHLRMDFEGPDDWSELEAYLPMKNRTLTYSYLLLSRSVQDSKWRGHTRVLGDTLVEKGKTRQLVCRGPQREFLAWLHKNGDAPRIPSGALLNDLGAFEKKSDELRVSVDLTWT